MDCEPERSIEFDKGSGTEGGMSDNGKMPKDNEFQVHARLQFSVETNRGAVVHKYETLPHQLQMMRSTIGHHILGRSDVRYSFPRMGTATGRLTEAVRF